MCFTWRARRRHLKKRALSRGWGEDLAFPWSEVQQWGELRQGALTGLGRRLLRCPGWRAWRLGQVLVQEEVGNIEAMETDLRAGAGEPANRLKVKSK